MIGSKTSEVETIQNRNLIKQLNFQCEFYNGSFIPDKIKVIIQIRVLSSFDEMKQILKY